jgi:hypothetical protein
LPEPIPPPTDEEKQEEKSTAAKEALKSLGNMFGFGAKKEEEVKKTT